MTYAGNTNVLFVIKEMRCNQRYHILQRQVYAGGALYTQVQPSHTLSQLFIIRRHTYMMFL